MICIICGLLNNLEFQKVLRLPCVWNLQEMNGQSVYWGIIFHSMGEDPIRFRNKTRLENVSKRKSKIKAKSSSKIMDFISTGPDDIIRPEQFEQEIDGKLQFDNFLKDIIVTTRVSDQNNSKSLWNLCFY